MKSNTAEFNLIVVEDNPGDYLLLESFLTASGLENIRIKHAECMDDVPPLVKNNHFDIALLDLTLPDSNGIDSVITMDRLLPKTPIIVFSGVSAGNIAMESISLGAQDYLVKGEYDERLLKKSIQYSIERKKTLEKLKESNERYELVTLATNEMVWDCNLFTNKIYLNDTATRLFGFRESYVDVEWFDNQIHPEDRPAVKQRLADHFNKKLKTYQQEFRLRDANGTYQHVLARGFILFDDQDNAYRMIGATSNISERKLLEKELEEQRLTQQRLIIEASIESQEKERNELGIELHDNINQILATVKMFLSMAQSKKEDSMNLIGQSYHFVIHVMEEIRKLSHSLVAPTLGQVSLENVLLQLVTEINQSETVQLKVENRMPPELKIDKRKELVLYRIVQEQVSNICKHSQAKNASIQLSLENNFIRLCISDDGKGFDASNKRKGIGLNNIGRRVEYYSGTMHITSTPGEGCTMIITIPDN